MQPLSRIAALLVMAAAVGACSTDRSPTASTGDAAGIAPSAALTVAEELELKEWEVLEKERLKLEQERLKPVFDSLKLVWERDRELYRESASPIVHCEPLQYTGDVKIMGPEGGEISIGPHKLWVPRGALDKHIVITGEMNVSLAVSVKLSPHGTQFARPVTLQLNYQHCAQPGDQSEMVAYTDAQLNVLEWQSSLDSSTGIVTGYLWHFSHYTVGRSSYATSW